MNIATGLTLYFSFGVTICLAFLGWAMADVAGHSGARHRAR